MRFTANLALLAVLLGSLLGWPGPLWGGRPAQTGPERGAAAERLPVQAPLLEAGRPAAIQPGPSGSGASGRGMSTGGLVVGLALGVNLSGVLAGLILTRRLNRNLERLTESVFNSGFGRGGEGDKRGGGPVTRFGQFFRRLNPRRRRAQLELEQERVFLGNILASLNTGLSLLNPDLSIAWVNDTTREMFPHGQPIGQRCHAFFESRREPCGRCQAQDVFRAGRITEIERFNPTTKRWYRILCQPLRGENGGTRVLQAIADVTERRQAEEERGRLVTAVEHAAESIVVTDPEGAMLYVNPAFERLTGYQRPEAVDRKRRILEDVQVDPAFSARIWETIRRGEVWAGRVTSRRRDGSQIELEKTISPVLDESGGVINYVAISRDVTREVMLEKQLAQAQKMEAIGTLAGGIAHDFNNILYAITGYSEMTLLDLPEEGRARRNMEEVLKACQRASALVDQILTFSRQSEQQLRPVQVSLIIKEILDLLRASLPATIDIQLRLKAGHDAIMADPTQIHQVLMNLCANAAQAMREGGGRLEISLTEADLDEVAASRHPNLVPGPHLLLAVGDTGPGIDPAIIDRIFDPFFTTKQPGEGIGMGLAVVQGIVSSHGGAIKVESQPGRGSRFEILLPRIELEAEVEVEVQVQGPLPRGSERVLFVDDERSLVEMARQILGRRGYRVEAFSSPAQALRTFRRRPDDFDLVITDYTMPHLTGLAMAKEMLSIRPEIPVIMCTGFSENVDRDKARAAGIREFVLKPIAGRQMAETIRRVLDV